MKALQKAKFFYILICVFGIIAFWSYDILYANAQTVIEGSSTIDINTSQVSSMDSSPQNSLSPGTLERYLKIYAGNYLDRSTLLDSSTVTTSWGAYNGITLGYSSSIDRRWISIEDENGIYQFIFCYTSSGGMSPWYVIQCPTPDGDINISQPTNGTTTSTTSVDIVVNITGNGIFDLTLVTKEFGLNGYTYTESKQIVLLGSTSYTYTYNLSATSTYTTTASIANVYTGNISQDIVTFHVLEISPQYIDSTQTWEDIPCSVTDLTGCFKRALSWAFNPTDDPFTDFISLWDGIKRKPPIGYFYVLTDPISSIGTTTTPLYTLEVPQPMKDSIFSVARLYIQYAFILLFIYFLWYRVTNLKI